MSNAADYVNELSDEQLYKELHDLGYPAGPVVGTTRTLYRNKLIKLLENDNTSFEQLNTSRENPNLSKSWSEDIPPSPPRLSSTKPPSPPRLSPVKPTSTSFSTKYGFSEDVLKDSNPLDSFKHTSVIGETYGRPLTSYTEATYSRPSTTFSSSKYGFSEDVTRGTDPVSKYQRSTVFSRPLDYTSGISSSRSYSDTFQDRPVRHRSMGGYSDYQVPKSLRHSQIPQKGKSPNSIYKKIMYVAVVILIIALIFIFYNAWEDADPYKQVEQEAMEIAESMKQMDTKDERIEY